jgi:multiple sugar transport system permease protein
MNRVLFRAAQILLLAIVVVVVLYPLYQMVILSLQPMNEITVYIGQLENRTFRFVPGYFLPRSFSLEQYIHAMDDIFLRAYIMTTVYAISITILQFPIALVLGFVFSKTQFKGRDFLFFLFLVAMVLPFHVTLVPMYQILQRIGLLNTPWAVILPGAFSPLGVFLIRQFFRQIPDDVLEAATIDGAGLLRIIVFVMIPIAKYGLAIFFLFTLTMQWSAIEPALAFVRSDEWQPVSLLLREYMDTNPVRIFAPGVLYIIPMLLLFGVLNNYLAVDNPKR